MAVGESMGFMLSSCFWSLQGGKSCCFFSFCHCNDNGRDVGIELLSLD